MAYEGHPLATDSSGRRRDEHESLSEAARLSLINPFDTRPQNPILNRDANITANGCPASSAEGLNPLGLRQRPQQQQFLEMEEVASNDGLFTPAIRPHGEEDLLEPIRTTSGLLLTHRQTAATPRIRPTVVQQDNDDKKRDASMKMNASLETEWGYASSRDSYNHRDPTSVMLQNAGRVLSFARVYIVIFASLLVIGTLSIIHSSTHEINSSLSPKIALLREKPPEASLSHPDAIVEADEAPMKIILIPIQDVLQLENTKQQEEQPMATLSHHETHPDSTVDGVRRVLKSLREEFEEWIEEHEKAYGSHEEKESRFHVWSQNHHQTIQKNKRHGPCKLTKLPVFGSNAFKDLTPEEFQSNYLTGYKGPKTDELEIPMQQLNAFGKNGKRPKNFTITPGSGMVLDAENRGDFRTAAERHPDVQKRLLEHLNASEMGKKYIEHWDHPNRNQSNYSYLFTDAVMEATLALQERAYKSKLQEFYDNSVCTWYDVSCWLRWVVDNYGDFTGYLNFSREPAYDSNSYPTAVDWRTVGAVTSVHSQGNCGACWAITAVETVESAFYLSTGKLYDLSETEIIACDDSCEMCNGGWPQNAYEYVMKQKGIPLENDLQYNGNFLLALTMVASGESEELSQEYLENYLASTCPSGSNNKNGKSRYGNIKGYGYATDRCVCYSDGSGCNCNDQNEELAIANLATYGPATVCLEASLWQDYSSGIITSASGCSAGFMDMNHCVQAVGYAFVNVDDNENSDNGHDDKKKGSTHREGYWIIRNQWSSSWGMKGYAYVAMGENTCGVLNDMTVAYM